MKIIFDSEEQKATFIHYNLTKICVIRPTTNVMLIQNAPNAGKTAVLKWR